jgi:hypothetical protein
MESALTANLYRQIDEHIVRQSALERCRALETEPAARRELEERIRGERDRIISLLRLSVGRLRGQLSAETNQDRVTFLCGVLRREWKDLEIYRALQDSVEPISQ